MVRATASLGILGALVTILAGAVICSNLMRNVQQRDLIGKYSASIGDEYQSIEIFASGRYASEFRKHGQQIWHIEGQWSFGYESSFHANAIEFYEFRLGFAEYSSSPQGIWPVTPSRSIFGNLEFCFDPDLNDRCFSKLWE